MFEWNYQLLNNEREKKRLKNEKNLNAFVEYSHKINDFYENWEDFIIKRKENC